VDLDKSREERGERREERGEIKTQNVSSKLVTKP